MNKKRILLQSSEKTLLIKTNIAPANVNGINLIKPFLMALT
ncbi:hypothetical protein [Enterobacter hormaechei]|nr:hypothetical protein [Enterobacter hormaechei]